MYIPLALSLAVLSTPPAVSAPPAPPAPPAPIRLKLSDDVLWPGERVRVKVKPAEDGYVVVLRVDAQGRVRILYPRDPDEPAAVRGGKEFEVKGRGDREAFVADEPEGGGTVLAAWSAAPFRFDAFTRAGHWDYSALAVDTTRGDGESVLLGLVDRLVGGGDDKYEYDVATYTVSRDAGRRYAGWYRPGYGPSWYGWYDPFFFGPRYRFGATFFFGRPYYRRFRRW